MYRILTQDGATEIREKGCRGGVVTGVWEDMQLCGSSGIFAIKGAQFLHHSKAPPGGHMWHQ